MIAEAVHPGNVFVHNEAYLSLNWLGHDGFEVVAGFNRECPTHQAAW